MNLTKIGNRFWLAALLGGAAMPVQLWAQDQTPQGGATVDDNTIVVTAQRRAERLEDVPMSIAVISPQTLQKSGIVGLADIGKIAPGVQINFAGLSTQPAIRGVTTLTNGAFAENNIGIYVDGFYVPDTLSINNDLVNISDIQVLKGPQGTLYGRNATGGAILINTLAPSSTWTGQVGLEYGRYNELTAKGYLSGPLSDRIRVAIGGASRASDGYLKFADPLPAGRDRDKAGRMIAQSVRFKVEGDATDNLTLTLGLNYGLAADPRGVMFTPRQYTALTPPPSPYQVAYNYGNFTRSTTKEVTFKAEWNTGIGTLTSRTGYAKRKSHYPFDFDGSYSDFTYSDTYQKNENFQQSVDYVIDAIDGLNLLVGGFYYNDKVRPDAQYASYTFGPGLALATGAVSNFNTEAYAFYIDGTYQLSENLWITAGGRYNHDSREAQQSVYNVAQARYTLNTSWKSASFNKFTPRASIRYQVAPNTNIYASYSKGYRAGSYPANTVAAESQLVPVLPETLDAYEIGFKTAGGIFRAELAGFYYDYKNYNVSITALNTTTGAPSTFTSNAPKAEIYGVDGSISLMLPSKTNVTVGGSWLHARYGTFANATGTGVNLSGASQTCLGNTGGTVANNRNCGSQSQDWTGKQMSRAPNFSGNISADQTFTVADGELTVSGNVKYTDSYVISNPSLYGPLAGALAGQQRYRQGAYTLIDAQLSWTDASGHYHFGVWGKNLTNKRYLVSYNGTSSFGDYGVPGAPITYGARIGYSF